MLESKSRRRASQRVLLATLWLTILMFVIKVWIGWAAQSLSLLAESLHSLLGAFGTILTLLAIAAQGDRTERSVHGHGLRESTLVLLMAAVLGFGGFNLVGLGAQKLMALQRGTTFLPVPTINLPLIQLMVVVWVVGLCSGFFERYQATVLQDEALQHNASFSIQAAWPGGMVLLGLVGIWRGWHWLDGFLAIAFVISAILSYWQILRWQLPLLVRHVAIAPEAIAQTLRPVQGVIHCYRIRSRGVVGRQVWIELHAVIHPEYAGATRLILERIEQALRSAYGPVDVTVYLESDRPPQSARTARAG